jgi:hypothetical protein
VHHVAFRTPDADYDAWAERLRQLRVPSSGPVDRFYFRSLYFREPNGILFEIASDGPRFAADEPLDSLGERLALSPSSSPVEPRSRRALSRCNGAVLRKVGSEVNSPGGRDGAAPGPPRRRHDSTPRTRPW